MGLIYAAKAGLAAEGSSEWEVMRQQIKINLGDLRDLQGATLYCLAQTERDAPRPSFDWIWLLLEELINSPNAVTRRHATAAVWFLPAINPPLFMALLCGLRDTDPDDASFSYRVLANKENIP